MGDGIAVFGQGFPDHIGLLEIPGLESGNAFLVKRRLILRMDDAVTRRKKADQGKKGAEEAAPRMRNHHRARAQIGLVQNRP